MLGTVFLLAAMALPGAATHPPSIEVVAPNRAAARSVPIVGATRTEVAVTRAALARLGRSQPIKAIEFGRQGNGRSIIATYKPSGAEGFQNYWLSKLALDDAGAQLSAKGENVTWTELRGPDGDGTGFEAVPGTTRSAREVNELAHRIAARAQRQPVTEITAYQVAGGAVRVLIQLSREQYLGGTNARWLDVVPDRFDPDKGYSADVLVLGPGGVRAAEGANFGSTGGAFAYGPRRPGRAAPLEGPVALRVTIHRNVPRQTQFAFNLDCAQASAACTDFRHEWTLLVPPTVDGAECGAPFGADAITVSGSVAGISIQRDYDGCYSGVVEGWEMLLGVPGR